MAKNLIANSGEKSIEIVLGIKEKELELLKAKLITRLDEINRQKERIDNFLGDNKKIPSFLKI